jgi:hypothetical protein
VDRRARSGGGQKGNQRCDQAADTRGLSPGCAPRLMLVTAIFGIVCTGNWASCTRFVTTPSTWKGSLPAYDFLPLQSCPALSSCGRYMPSYVRAFVIFLSLFEDPVRPRTTFPASEPGVAVLRHNGASSLGQQKSIQLLIHKPAHSDVHHDPQRQEHEQH